MDSNIINWYFGSIGRDNELVTFFLLICFLTCTRKTSKASQWNISALKILATSFLARGGVYDVQNRFWLVEIRDMRVLKHAYLR